MKIEKGGCCPIRTVIPGTFFEAAKTAFNAVISLKYFCLLFGTFFEVEGGTKVKISDFCVCCNFLCITAHCKSIFSEIKEKLPDWFSPSVGGFSRVTLTKNYCVMMC